MVAPLERWSDGVPLVALRENPSLLLVAAHPMDTKLVCALQQMGVAGAGPMLLLVRPSLVGVASSAWPSLLHQRASTLAVMEAVCFFGMHGLVALPVGCSHEQRLLVPCQQHCSGAAVRAELRFAAFPVSTSSACVSVLWQAAPR
jgi:hypothetical protein